MKKNLLFVLPALALAFASCNNDEDSPGAGFNNPVITGDPATLTIELKGESSATPGLRATGPEGSNESKVNDGIIYVFDTNGNVIKKAFFKSGDFTASPTTKTVSTTTAAKTVSVLLNVGVSDSASLVGKPYDVPTKTQLEALTVQLAATNGTGASTQLNNNLYMSGASTGTLTFTGTPLKATANVTVSRLASRVKINWTFAPNSTFTNKIKLTGAVVLNARSDSKLFGTPLYPASGSKYIQGLAANVLSGFPASTGYKPADADVISNTAVFSVSPFEVPQTNENYFYIFENAATNPTIVAIVADYNENGIGSGIGTTLKKYYPVVINKASTGGQDGTMTIKRNNQYAVTATIKGLGVDNPFDPIDPANLDVIVTVANWNLVINVNQTFD